MGNRKSSSVKSKDVPAPKQQMILVAHQNTTHVDELNIEEITAKETPTLPDLGFEYRAVYCDRHSDESCDHDSTGKSRVCFDCELRLFHTDTSTVINPQNLNQYVPDGHDFDEVSRTCQETAHKHLLSDYGLKFVTICNESTNDQPLQALMDEDCHDGKYLKEQPTLLVMTGKGKSRAGVLSVKHLITSGFKRGSALFHLIQARKRGWAVVFLDPNARGCRNGMNTVELSLNHLFADWKAPLYVLAHSASGGYLVRYLLSGTTGEKMSKNIHAIVFTDSTHRIGWAMRKHPSIFRLLQSSKCLYIRNNSLGSPFAFDNDGSDEEKENKNPGDEADRDVWWRQRFGDIRTVWAGTTDHSGVCWTARDVIWSFFDDIIEKENQKYLTNMKAMVSSNKRRSIIFPKRNEEQLYLGKELFSLL